MAHAPLPVGERVVVRSTVPGERGPSGGPAMTDVVGLLEAYDEDVLVVRRRDGTTCTVQRVDILVIKVVPPAAQRRG